MENNIRNLTEDEINKICDNIQIFCADEEVVKAVGKVDGDKHQFLARLYEFMHQIDERNEEMQVELGYRKYLYNALLNVVIPEEYDKQHRQELDRTKEIIAGMEAVLKLDEAKKSIFQSDFAKRVIDNYDFLKDINTITGNTLGMNEYYSLQNSIKKEMEDKYSIRSDTYENIKEE